MRNTLKEILVRWWSVILRGVLGAGIAFFVAGEAEVRHLAKLTTIGWADITAAACVVAIQTLTAVRLFVDTTLGDHKAKINGDSAFYFKPPPPPPVPTPTPPAAPAATSPSP